MEKEDYIKALILIKDLLEKTFLTDKVGKIWGYNSSAIDIVDALLKRKGLL